MTSQQIAHLHSLCVLVIVIFHSLLILGKPWGHLTMAGKFQGKLPVKMKFFSLLSIVILISVAIMIEIGGGSITVESQDLRPKLIIAVIVFNIVQSILHIITPSKWERILWLPIILIMLSSSLALYFLLPHNG